MRNLTESQEIFCQEMATGKTTQTAAYKKAYPKAEKWAMNTIYCSASQLAKMPKIQDRIIELRDLYNRELARRYVWSKERATQSLMNAVEKIEANLEEIDTVKEKLKQEGAAPEKVLSYVSAQTNFTTKALKDVAQELNTMYGLNKTNIDFDGKVAQVVFEGEADLPPDEEVKGDETE